MGFLFAATWVDPAASEAALTRLAGRLGEASIACGVAVDERRPERQGRWAAVVGAEQAEVSVPQPSGPRSDPSASQPLRACLRLLDRPARAEPRRDGQLLVRGSDIGTVVVRTWHGPERLSGHWWEDAYDRDYYWALAGDGRVFWVYRDRRAGGWFLHGWLD